MSNKMSYDDQLKRAYNKAVKGRNKAAALYYSQQFWNTSACVSFEKFVKSWAGENWLKKYQDFL